MPRHPLRQRIEKKLPTINLTAIRRLVRVAEPAVRSAWTRAVRLAAANVNGSVGSLVRQGRIDEAFDAIAWDDTTTPILRGELMQQLRTVYESGAAQAAKLVPDMTGFSVVDPRPARWLSEMAGNRIVQIDADTRDGIRATLTQAHQSGLSANETARLIRPQIGLHQAWVDAVGNFRADLETQGLSAARIERETIRYATQLRQARATSIARTEVNEALNAGRDEAWAQAAEQELFDPSTATLRWVMAFGEHVESDPCPSLDGQTADYRNPQFTSDDGDMFDGPPAHPNCRCVLQLEP